MRHLFQSWDAKIKKINYFSYRYGSGTFVCWKSPCTLFDGPLPANSPMQIFGPRGLNKIRNPDMSLNHFILNLDSGTV